MEFVNYMKYLLHTQKTLLENPILNVSRAYRAKVNFGEKRKS